MIVDVAVVGAGPYGLSIASHLRARGIDFRIFGSPMQTWQSHMPKGMFLKSEGFASSLYDPASSYTLAKHAQEKGIAYAHTGLPVSLKTFCDYGVAFQEREVPDLERHDVVAVQACQHGFDISLDNGDRLTARKVVFAVGITHFAYRPPELAMLPDELVTHSSEHHDLSKFAGREMIVLGAGASAIDFATLLHLAGARVRLVSRQNKLAFLGPPGPSRRPLIERLRAPQSGLGPGWRSRLCTDAPLLFHTMPSAFRLKVVKRHLGPAAGWWTKDVITNNVQCHLGLRLRQADIQGDRIRIDLSRADGTEESLTADHLIAATGYHPDLKCLSFLNSDLRSRIRTVDGAPALTTNFESSVKGAYFTGLSSGYDFGPMMRFAFGAGFTARSVSRHLERAVGGRTQIAMKSRARLSMVDAA